jgi:hypothetical protein
MRNIKFSSLGSLSKYCSLAWTTANSSTSSIFFHFVLKVCLCQTSKCSLKFSFSCPFFSLRRRNRTVFAEFDLFEFGCTNLFVGLVFFVMASPIVYK